jgi:hypothetical protein
MQPKKAQNISPKSVVFFFLGGSNPASSGQRQCNGILIPSLCRSQLGTPAKMSVSMDAPFIKSTSYAMA